MQNIRNFGKTNIEILSLPIDAIKIADYQRGVDKEKVKRIVENYDPHKMRPIEVSYRGGYYWCVDGQHRLDSLRQRGEASISAQVHHGLSYQQEALLFAKQHENETHINKRQEWKALCEANDPSARRISSVCKKFGFEVGGDMDNGKGIGAIRELQKIEARHGERGLEDTLFVLRTAFQNDPSTAHHDIVAGMCKILDTYPKLSDYEFNRFVQVLTKMSPRVLLKKATTERGRGGKQVAKTIIIEYNKGLKIDSKSRLNEQLIH